MKRMLSLALAAAVLAVLALPAAAAEPTADARLARVTQAVKETLDLETGAYDSFRGSCSEDLVPLWSLNWENEDASLSVEALEDGTVVGLYRWEKGSGVYRGDGFPAFPGGGGEEAAAAARAFLDRVLLPGEEVDLKTPEDGLYSGRNSCSWDGRVTLNGLPTPLDWYLTVENGQVTSFHRETAAGCCVGNIPSPEPSADRDKAAADLTGTLKLKLEYVLEKGTKKAVLRYVPEDSHDYLVDAKTGELLDLTELRDALSEKGVRTAAGMAEDAAAEAPAATNGKTLTDAEREGVQKLEGVLSKEELDKALRADGSYGLRGYALTAHVYTPWSDEDSGKSGVDCELRYARSEGGERVRRNITVDAKTGEVKAVWSSAPYDRPAKLTEAQAREKAEAYLKALCPDRAPVFYSAPENQAVPLREKKAPSYLFRFARQENGIFFPANAYQVSIDASDGSVYGLSVAWDEDVTFDGKEGVVSPETALSAWAGTYETILAYRQVPQKLNRADPAQAKLLEAGQESAYALRLTYGLEREERCLGVDAKTGAPVTESRGRAERAAIQYGDLSGSSARADIEKLARYGVGYASDRFSPGKTVTQWELAALLYSLRGEPLDPGTAEKGERDAAYYELYRMGALQPGQRDDSAVLTRGDVVKMLLDAAGYGSAARLDGKIFRSDYTDGSSIPEGEAGYAAIAQALGMTGSAYAGERSATRGEAASMLCRVLERET